MSQEEPCNIVVGLWQARYALRDFDKKQPGCGFAKLADICVEAADKLTSLQESDHPPTRGCECNHCTEYFGDKGCESSFHPETWNQRVPKGYKLIKDSTLEERRWGEDASDEDNGNYLNTCRSCGRLFVGYKRRTVCKACSDSPPITDSTAANLNPNHFLGDPFYQKGVEDTTNLFVQVGEVLCPDPNDERDGVFFDVTLRNLPAGTKLFVKKEKNEG